MDMGIGHLEDGFLLTIPAHIITTQIGIAIVTILRKIMKKQFIIRPFNSPTVTFTKQMLPPMLRVERGTLRTTVRVQAYVCLRMVC